MKVKMVTLAAGPDGLYQPGQVVDLPDEQAKALIAGGYAEEVIPSDVERRQPVSTERETAAVEPPEKAVSPKKTRKRRSSAK